MSSRYTSTCLTRQWYPEVLHFCPTTPIILVGLKSDLRSKRTCVELLKTQGLNPISREQGETVAKQMNATYAECSSKEMRGVDEVFNLAINKAVAAEETGWQNHRQSYNTSSKTGPSGGGGGKRIKKRTCKIL